MKGKFLDEVSLFINDAITAESPTLLEKCLANDFRKVIVKTLKAKGASLSKANLSGAILKLAHLEGANLEGANLKGSNVTDAWLNEANLKGANLSGANLTDADVSGADFTNVKYDSKTTWPTKYWEYTTCPDGSSSETNQNCGF